MEKEKEISSEIELDNLIATPNKKRSDFFNGFGISDIPNKVINEKLEKIKGLSSNEKGLEINLYQEEREINQSIKIEDAPNTFSNARSIINLSEKRKVLISLEESTIAKLTAIEEAIKEAYYIEKGKILKGRRRSEIVDSLLLKAFEDLF